MPHSTVEPMENRLLAMLPREECERRRRPHLEHVSFALGEVIYESGGQQRPTVSDLEFIGRAVAHQQPTDPPAVERTDLRTVKKKS